MRSLAVLVVAVLAGCDGSGFDYSAQVGYDPYTDPEIQSIIVDGQAVDGLWGTVHRSYSGYADAATSSVHVEAVMTSGGTLAFDLVPSDCGHAPNACGGPNTPSCDDLESESETWVFYHGYLTVGSGADPLEFGADEGNCTFTDGSHVSWAD